MISVLDASAQSQLGGVLRRFRMNARNIRVIQPCAVCRRTQTVSAVIAQLRAKHRLLALGSLRLTHTVLRERQTASFRIGDGVISAVLRHVGVSVDAEHRSKRGGQREQEYRRQPQNLSFLQNSFPVFFDGCAAVVPSNRIYFMRLRCR